MAFRKIGKLFGLSMLFSLAVHPAGYAKDADVQFTADVDRAQVSADESVSLRLKIRADGSTSISDPTFSAPDFDEVNQYSSVFVESYYENGRFGMRNNHSVTKVLRPRKTGDLKISNLRIEAGGKTYSAPDIVVHVRAAGAGTPPPKGYGGTGVGLRGAGKQLSHRNVIVRAEIDKDRAYKGEQVIVSYYIYTRVQLFNIAVDKWPTLNGFLRADLETPVMSSTGRMDSEQVVLDGAPYRRSLLVRYAAYPLQDGKLRIDPLALKYNYYPARGSGLDDDEDPFMNFFQQMQAREGNDRSDTLTLDVVPVPEEGRPNSFTGGVGDFSLTSAIDKTDVKTNEALTLTVKVEGRGNVASIGEPKAKWPDNLELYDTKGRAKTGKAGVGEKVFEFLLIPRTPGPITLPKMELSFFDPQKKAYVTKTTEPISINVQPGAPGSYTPPRSSGSTAPAAPSSGTATPAKEDLRYLKAPSTPDALTQPWPLWRILYWAALSSLVLFLLVVTRDLLQKGRETAQALMSAKAKAHARSWEKLKSDATAANLKSTQRLPWKDVVAAYDLLASSLFDALEKIHPEGLRSRPRPQVRELLLKERNFPEAIWERIDKTLDYADMVRFAASAGVVSEDSARAELARWIDEAQSIVRLISQRDFK